MRRTVVWASLALACSSPAGREPARNASQAREAPKRPASAAAPSASAVQPNAALPGASAATNTTPAGTAGGTPCGKLDCLAFPSPEAAFDHVLARAPRILAVGEAHAQKGSESIRSATDRFGAALLPRLAGRATDLVIELLIADGKCRKVEQRVQQRTSEVTQGQTATAQNEFVELGHRAKALRIRPHALTPSCEEYAAITRSGQNDIAALLETVSRITARQVTKLLSNGDSALIVSYGGAIHNDVSPRAGREAWSFGPELSARAAYIELDLIVPEYVKDTEAWRSLPWYEALASAPRSDSTRLFATGPRSFVLVFPNAARE
jgi:hypothetical protein